MELDGGLQVLLKHPGLPIRWPSFIIINLISLSFPLSQTLIKKINKTTIINITNNKPIFIIIYFIINNIINKTINLKRKFIINKILIFIINKNIEHNLIFNIIFNNITSYKITLSYTKRLILSLYPFSLQRKTILLL